MARPLVPPLSPSFQNFSSAWQQGDLGPEVVNTIVYAVSAAAISTVLSLFIAFPIARRLVRWSSGLYRFIVLGICLPLPIIPLFIEARTLHLYDNRIGYIILHDIIGPVVFLSNPSLFPVTRGVYNFYSSNESAYTLLAAAVIIVSLPVVALFLASQRQLLRSTMGISA